MFIRNLLSQVVLTARSAARVVTLRVASGSGLLVLSSLALPFAAEVPHTRAVAWLASSRPNSRDALQFC